MFLVALASIINPLSGMTIILTAIINAVSVLKILFFMSLSCLSEKVYLSGKACYDRLTKNFMLILYKKEIENYGNIW